MKVIFSTLQLQALGWVAIGICLFAAELRALEPRSSWVRARTPYVEVLSDASQNDATEYALQYSALAAAARKGALRAELFQPRLDKVDIWLAATERQRAGK